MFERFLRNFFSIIIPLLWVAQVHAQDMCMDGCTCGETDIAPTGIMNDHVHEKGKWMFSYRYMRMDMQGNISGSASVSSQDIYNSYIMAPDKMTMDMHMLMVMYGVSDHLSLMLMPSFQSATMHMNMIDGSNTPMNMPGMAPNATMPDNMTIAGLGDTRLDAIYALTNTMKTKFVVALGVSMPTGSIHKKALPGTYNNLRADYNMQTGSGTFDIMPSASLVKHYASVDFGIQLMGILRPFYNSNGYHTGNEAELNAWCARKWNSWISNSVRLNMAAQNALSGYDAGLYSVLEPSADAANYGGCKAYIYPGVNFYPGHFLADICKIRLEYGIPLYQYANGIQMADRSRILAGLDITL